MEQLVEVPTVVSYSSLQQHTAEQTLQLRVVVVVGVVFKVFPQNRIQLR